MKTLIVVGIALVVWFVISELLSWLLCELTSVPLDAERAYSLRVGVFMAPVIIALACLALLTWSTLRFFNWISLGLIPAPRDPMEYFL